MLKITKGLVFKNFLMTLTAFSLCSCTSYAYLTVNSSPAGAYIKEHNTGINAPGRTPYRFQYELNPAFIDKDGCMRVNGFELQWESGAKSSSNNIFLCKGAAEHEIYIPYTGYDQQLAVDKAAAENYIAEVRHQQELQQQAADESNANLWVAAIVGVAGVAANTAYPTTTYRPTPVTTYSPPKNIVAPQAGCLSDVECGIGRQCVKAPLQSRGQCMTPVNEFGVKNPIPAPPRPESALPNMNIQGQCQFDTQCSIGFKCDAKLKVCVK